MLLAVALLVAFVLRVVSPPVESRGAARAIDGDSLEMRGHEFRLRGIDAPEYRQTCRDERGRGWACGREARRALAELIRRGTVVCTSSERDRYGRDLATCRAGDIDLNREMVRLGLAVTYIDPGASLLMAEKEAKAARRGLWRGPFEKPSAWREREKLMRGDVLVD
jgi:endonuclease YncB( thermonuclease family)